MTATPTTTSTPPAPSGPTVLDLARLLKDRLPKGKKPYPYQVQAVHFALEHHFRCLIADEMGLGKLVEALCCIAVAPKELLPAVVVCPASVLGTWALHIGEWLPGTHVVLLRSRADRIGPPRRRTIYLLSWRMLREYVEELLLRNPRLVILDEVQACKHPDTLVSQSAFALCRADPRLLLLTGTPIENTPTEAWPLLRLLDPGRFADREAFVATYGAPEALGALLPTYMIRRTKADVKLDLPAKTRSYLSVELPPLLFRFYEKVRHDLDTWLAAQHKVRVLERAAAAYTVLRDRGVSKREAVTRSVLFANGAGFDSHTARLALVQVGHLWRLAGRLKVGLVLQRVQDHFAAGGGPMVVFAWHKAVVSRLCKGLRALGLRWTRVDGSVTGEKRDERFQSFQAGAYDVIVLSRAANSGVTLTAASDVLFAERWMVPAWEEQGEDRVYRISQHNPTFVTYLLAKGTVDERFHELVDKKRAVVERVLRHERVLTQVEEADVHGAVSASLARAMVKKLEEQFTTANDARITAKELVEALKRR